MTTNRGHHPNPTKAELIMRCESLEGALAGERTAVDLAEQEITRLRAEREELLSRIDEAEVWADIHLEEYSAVRKELVDVLIRVRRDERQRSDSRDG